MQESIVYQSTKPSCDIPIPLALNGILTPEEYSEQTKFGLLRGVFAQEPDLDISSKEEFELYHPYFVN
ncbi:MAG: hypothetical protein HQL71_10475 [Magnetococcales bacterium]|nr:hypothetical protein [Magnetococcales bacterium]